MNHRYRQSVLEIALSRITGIVIFLILVGVLNFISGPESGPVLRHATIFVNANVVLILLFSVLFFAGEVLGALSFPVNLSAPIFNAMGSVLLVMFLFRLFAFVADITGVNAFNLFSLFALPVYVLVFIAVLAGGYYQILHPGKRAAKQ